MTPSTTNLPALPRAVASGVIFGNVDCYVLADGSTVLSQRGMLSGLRGDDGPEKGDLGRYLARLPEKYSALATDPNFDFVRPDGGVAIGRPARDFVAMCRAYAEMYAEGSIHKARVPMARNAIGILSYLADRGIDEIIYEATGHRPPVVTIAPAPVASPDALAVLERVAAQMEALNARLEAVERRPSNANGPSLGAGAARIHVLGPLRDIARIEASAMKRADKHAVMSLRTIAENQLRDRVDFPRYGGQSWAAFPENRLGELHAALARLLHDARKRAGVAAGKPAQMNLLPSAAKPRSPSA